MQVTVGFERAIIKIDKEKEFAELKNVLTRIFESEKIEPFLKLVQRKGIRIRDFDLVLASGFLEQLGEELTPSAKTPRQLYEELTTPDQGQMREFYLSKIEEVQSELRTRFHKLYSYY